MKNAINRAREQLPTDRPTIVFFGIPDTWVKHPALETAYREALSDALSRTGRISAVIARWLEWRQFDGVLYDGVNQVYEQGIGDYRTDHNPKARFPLTEFGDKILDKIFMADSRIRWRRIPDIIGYPYSIDPTTYCTHR